MDSIPGQLWKRFGRLGVFDRDHSTVANRNSFRLDEVRFESSDTGKLTIRAKLDEIWDESPN